MRSQRKSKPSPLSLFADDGTLSDSASDSASILASFYQSVYNPDVPSPNLVPQPTSLPSLTFIDFPTTKIGSLLSKCDPGGSPGPDGVHPRILKECASELSVPFSILFRTSFSSGILPSTWKQSIIHPIFKSGSRHKAENYRPISLTSIPCKIMEKIVHFSLHSHFSSHNLFHPSQHGFTPGRSCLSNLTTFYSKVSIAREDNKLVDAVFFDFTKAFDKLPHSPLITAMQNVGISGPLLHWLSSFISNRSSVVRVAGSLSAPFTVTSGVPQGSVCGPDLFLIFINPLPSLLPCRSLLFADDLKIWAVDNPVSLQSSIDLCVSWSLANHLPINPSKTLHISFYPHSSTTFTLPSTPSRTVIESSNKFKDLGVWISSDLSPSLMCAESAKKAMRTVNFLFRSFKFLDKKSFITLYSLYVRPLLEYCSIVWLPWLKKHETILENVQRKATKLLPSIRTLSYPNRLSSLDLFPLHYRRLRGCFIYTFKLFKANAYSEFFTLSPANGLRGHKLKLFQPRADSKYRRNSFAHVVIPFWNKLPATLITAPSIAVFKSTLDEVLPGLLNYNH